MRDLLRAIYTYRLFILSSIKNELHLRFVRSKLGALWIVIHPLMQVLIFALILSEVLSAKLPGIDNKYAYALYLMAGTLCWALFSETISKCLTLFIDNGNLMKKMAFPRVCLPLIAAGTALVNNVLLFVAILMVFAALGHFPDHHLIWLPALILVTMLMAMSVGLLLGTMNVFMRDIGQIVPVILQALFWLTPIVYNISILPPTLQHWFKYNPLYPLVTSYQNIMVFGREPLWESLAAIAVVSCILSVAALIVFRRASPEMVDSL
ncbi:ABC transporter permease [Pseudoxanthomonas indica]|uniref:Transport permease protein n=1 Tax=Pseudoxanthomonas indica TaxID=428993 RepID=A0A1T5LFQ7_9GAMM|nr:ABC transporter permease [Pseudoxanthomonas indica]GGD34169.1 transport permease protein [Pseudoxanthomonas indica]SKC74228.1 lipopolysaccharide transport system permease protein [Pseudoxanthomonas indica]